MRSTLARAGVLVRSRRHIFAAGVAAAEGCSGVGHVSSCESRGRSVFFCRQLNADAAASVAAVLMLILSADIAAVSNADDADVACRKRCRC